MLTKPFSFFFSSFCNNFYAAFAYVVIPPRNSRRLFFYLSFPFPFTSFFFLFFPQLPKLRTD